MDSEKKHEEGNEDHPIDACVMGRVADSFVCSHNLPKAIDADREEQLRRKGDCWKIFVITNSSYMCSSADVFMIDYYLFSEVQKPIDEEEKVNTEKMESLIKEFNELQKKEENWDHWASDYSDFSESDAPEGEKQ